ncbi:MAG: hypothetical protein ACFCUG_08355 [Thiotrichales bacterium]
MYLHADAYEQNAYQRLGEAQRRTVVAELASRSSFPILQRQSAAAPIVIADSHDEVTPDVCDPDEFLGF